MSNSLAGRLEVELTDSVEVRQMREQDLESAERASAITFFDGDRLTRRVTEPEIQPRSVADSKRWIDRVRFFLSVDPEGCWVAADAQQIVGFAISQNRGRVWYLATYGVVSDRQRTGIGKRLLDATLTHAGDRRGMFISTVHPGATRRYRQAGFMLHPLMRMVGTVDRTRLPAVTGLREGEASDLDWMDRLDERLRGAGHGPDHAYMLDHLRLVVCKGMGAYAYIDDKGLPVLLAASDQQSAEKLLWEALASAQGETLINCITAENIWAVDVGLAARLDIGQEGYLALRSMNVPAPYLASGQFL